jgi:uncharacterized membrane protein
MSKSKKKVDKNQLHLFSLGILEIILAVICYIYYEDSNLSTVLSALMLTISSMLAVYGSITIATGIIYKKLKKLTKSADPFGAWVIGILPVAIVILILLALVAIIAKYI